MERLEVTRVQQYKSDVAFKTLVEGINENLYFVPQYQRKFRWKKSQVQELARSLIKGYPIPPIYAYRNGDGQLEILDGQQRIMSFFFYYIGKFINTKTTSSVDFRKFVNVNKKYEEVLNDTYDLVDMKTVLNSEKEKAERIDISYSALPLDLKRKLDYTTITIIELRWEDPDDKAVDLQVIFKNLNSRGTLLSPQEVRNGIYNCGFYDMLRDINSNSKRWRSIWGRESKDESDMEFLLRLCTLKKYVDYKGGEFIINEYSGKYSVWMDKFSEYSLKMGANELMDYKNSLLGFFGRFELNRVVGMKKALLESIYVVYEKCGVDVQITNNMIGKIQSSASFSENSRQGTVKKVKMNKRWKGVYEIISGIGESGS